MPEESEINDILDLSDIEDSEDDSPMQCTFDEAAGCGTEISSCSVLVKLYSLRHNLTKEALADLLDLLRLYSSTLDIVPRSV